MSTPRPADPTAAVKHSLFEDALGILTGTFVISLGLYLLESVSAVTGGTAGLSLLVSYVLPAPFAVLFVLVNLPFFLLAIRMKGWDFTLRTGLSIALVSGFSTLHPAMLGHVEVAPAYGVVAGNVLAGVGLLILFRHRASLGGFNIVALVAQDRLGWRAGYVQMALDTAVVLAAVAVVPPATVLLSVLGAVLLSVILAVNHRPGRYTGY
ncbi:putative 5xTM membrane YitT family protein [Isoptericola jiangsuensis]|uniref:Putative 5xTM membrane YitT family protein n=1 Tax=Isoptericola jiangsuensis TaxID=548579 RepID=A0A2A9EVJ4_9MICO|nr:YitT family protein [Isoptericola jiangsuensis]PFG43167.1 putative 5xTM membrane YitT family protein [Isoptericola jiangsuensis]